MLKWEIVRNLSLPDSAERGSNFEAWGSIWLLALSIFGPHLWPSHPGWTCRTPEHPLWDFMDAHSNSAASWHTYPHLTFVGSCGLIVYTYSYYYYYYSYYYYYYYIYIHIHICRCIYKQWLHGAQDTWSLQISPNGMSRSCHNSDPHCVLGTTLLEQYCSQSSLIPQPDRVMILARPISRMCDRQQGVGSIPTGQPPDRIVMGTLFAFDGSFFNKIIWENMAMDCSWYSAPS